MSGDWWANQVGTAAAATTPTGSIPQYSLAADVGTAAWPDQYTFNTWAEDATKRAQAPNIAKAQAKKDSSDESWFNKAVGAIGSTLAQGVGFIAGGPFQETTPKEQRQQAGELFGALGDLPGMHTVGKLYDNFYQGVSTPFVASTEAYRNDDPWWFLKGDNWSEAWQLAEDRSPGQAAVDWVLTGQDPQRAQKDLDRMKRTNSLYGLTSFAADLAISWKIDPTVIAAKGAGEARKIRAGELPHTGGGIVPTTALNAARGGERYAGQNPLGHYGQWRGDRIARNFDELRDAAQRMPFADFQNMSMFRRRNATNGAAAAELFRVAAKDDKLWDLTQRAVLSDPKAWAEIKTMQTDPVFLKEYFGSEGRTYLDALKATKGEYKQLDQEVKDLERMIAEREAVGPGNNPGFWEFYNKELHSTLEQRTADLEELAGHLDQYESHKTWLDGVPTFSNPSTNISSVKVKPGALDYLSQHTYQEGVYGKVHQIHEISKGGWLREANPIDLHHVDSGVTSLRRQFEQFDHLFGYRDPLGMNGALESFTQASMAGDTARAARIAKEVEDYHLPLAAAQHFGLEPETVRAFLNQTKFRMNEMTNALLSGENVVYTTVPGQEVKLLRRENGQAVIELTEGAKRTTIKVPEEALEGLKGQADLAQDITQTPNWYTPLNTRQVFLAIKRDPELFAELDTAMRSGLRRTSATAMEAVDKWGTAWNKFWKPAQLFRLAWPQRVLMDEGLRGMAMLGVSQFASSYGRAFGYAANNFVTAPARYFERRKMLKIGPGPLADRVTGRSYDTALHDAALEDVPFVPSYFAPKRSKARAGKLDEQIAVMQMVRENNLRSAALARAENTRNVQAMKRLTTKRPGIHTPAMPSRISATPPPTYPYTLPVNKAFDAFQNGEFKIEAPRRMVVDPISGRSVKSGLAVPVASKELRKLPGELKHSAGNTYPQFAGHYQHDLNDFVAANAELLGSGGYRLMFERGGQLGDPTKVHVVRVFRDNELDRAVAFTQHADAGRFINLTKGHTEYVREWKNQSPIMEALDRQFQSVEEEAFLPGESPAKGVPPVYHGSGSELPDPLLSRQDAPLVRGQLYGQGFYTTVDRSVAETYSEHGLYTIRGARDGKTYKVFDLEQRVTQKDADDLITFGDEEVARRAQAFRDQGTIARAEDLEDYWSSLKRDIPRGYQWRALFENHSPWMDDPARVDTILTNFLEQKRNAGALTHIGGVFTGNVQHQVYIWLHPENLMVKPAYGKTGKWYALEDWFDNPESLDQLSSMQQSRRFAGDPVFDPETGAVLYNEPGLPQQLKNQVPESRIHRVGPKPRAQVRQIGGELRAQERAIAEGDMFDELDFELAKVDTVHEAFLRRLAKRRQFGKGWSTFKDAEGNAVHAPNALEGPGEVYIPLMSGAPAYARLTDAYKRTLSRGQSTAVGYKRILPPDLGELALKTPSGRKAAVEYYTSWADLVNDQIRNSPIWNRMLQGQSDDQIIHWLENTGEGAKLRHTLPHKGYDPVRWVEEHRQALDFYVPRRDLQALLRERRISPSDLRRVEKDSMPEIYGPDLELIEGSTRLGRAWGNFVERTYTALGTTPTDILSRQPFFDGMYRLKMKNLMRATDPEDLTEELVQAYAKQSREFALRQVKRTMYDLGDDSNFTQAIRFLAPFWGAQEEAVRKWMGIAIERPETVARFYLGMNLAYDRLTVVDEDGKPTKNAHTLFGYNPNDRVILQIPKALRKIAPFDKMLGQFGSVGIAFGSANTALQGDQPLLPSLGPLVTMPADKLINMLWEDHGTSFDDNFFYRWLFPVGRPAGGVEGYMDYIMPGWGRRMSQLRQGQDSRTYANTYFTVLREMERDHRKRGLPPPTPEEIDSAVKWHFALRIIAGFAAPVAMEFRPEHQFYLDQYHAMQQQYGPSRAFEKFVEKFGADAARYAASSSESVAGVPPTAAGMAEWKSSKQLIAKYQDWGSAIISPNAWADDFSSDAYGAQFQIKLGPGTSDTLREMRDADQRIADTDTRLGWLDYRRFQSALNAELYARGLNSITQNGAEDLAVLKEQFIGDLAKRYPAWNDDYRTFSDTIYQRVAQLQEFAYDKRFDNRPDFQGVRQYLMLRDQVAQSLDEYHATTGGSRSLQAEENTNLRNWFYAQVGQLIQDNPMFGEFYTRYLDSDSLERGSGP